jgi:hypothetical protein
VLNAYCDVVVFIYVQALRQLLFDHTVSDIRNVNLKARNEKMNKTLQGFMYTMLQVCILVSILYTHTVI